MPHGHRLVLLLAALASAACGDDGGGADADGGGGGSVGCEGSARADQLACTAWMFNTTGETSANLTTSDGDALLVNVQSADIETVDGQDFVVVRATGIPSYRVTITQDHVDALTNRPNAANDFRSGAPTVAVDDVVELGADIGYASNNACQAVGGFGWWPPGPMCPADQANVYYVRADPVRATATCYTQLGTMGLFVNGTSIFHWADGFSYNNQNAWHNIASQLEVYDVDVCGGHAEMTGDYHQHGNPVCLGEQLGDDGSAPSPVYGFAADGYPIYGPWHAANTRAESCWKARDYDDANSATGCGTAGVRSCTLDDPADPSAGTTSVQLGPTTDETVTSLSGNTFTAVSGIYYEDYWFDTACAEAGGAALDMSNGHDHDDLGYHYHITESFPYNIGPVFAGTLATNAVTDCSNSPFQNGP